MTWRAHLGTATVLLAILGGCQTDPTAAPPRGSSTAATRTGSSDAGLDLVALRWLLSPPGTCPPRPLVSRPRRDDQTRAFLEVLNIEPAPATACTPTEHEAR